MGTYVGVTVDVSNFDPARKDDIVNALGKCFRHNVDTHADNEFISYYGECFHSYSDLEEDGVPSDEAAAVYEANRGPCNVTVRITFLEDAPVESFFFETEEEFKGAISNVGNGDKEEKKTDTGGFTHLGAYCPEILR